MSKIQTKPEDGVEITFESSDELARITREILAGANRTIDISSRHLDPIIYEQDEIVEAIKQLALNNRLARIRILVHDLKPVVTRGHRVINLAQRLSSFISIRIPGKQHRNFNEAMLIADNTAYIHRSFADRYEGLANTRDRGKARDLTSRFDELWEKGELPAGIRRLHI